MLIGICLWLAPQLALSGGLELLYDGLAFTSKHFTAWGGTFVSAAALEHQQLGYRLTMFCWGLWAYGLGGWWVDTSWLRLVPSLVMLSAFGLCWPPARCRKRAGCLLLYVVPYGLWTFVGQHADQPRHLLPLIPVLLIMLAVGLARWRRLARLSGGIACVLLLVVLGGLSTRLVIIHRLTPPPRLQVLQYVLAHFEPQATRLYAWGTRRLFAFYAPTFDVHQRHDLPAARRHLEASSTQPSILLVTSDVAGVPTSPEVRLVQLFQRDRYVHNPHWQQGLYRWFPPGMPASQMCQGCAAEGQRADEHR